MKNLTIARKLALIIGILVLWGGSMGGFLLADMQGQSTSYKNMLIHEVADADAARVIQVGFKKQVQEWKDILLRGSDPAALHKYRDAFFAKEAEVASQARALAARTSEPNAVSQLRAFVAAHKRLGENYRVALESFGQSGGKNFTVADQTVKGLDRAPTDLIDGVINQINGRVHRFVVDRDEIMAQQRTRTLGISVILLLAVLTLALAVTRSITSAQHEIIRGLEAMAAGDLSRRLDDSRKDEMGRIVGALNGAMDAARAAQARVAEESAQRELIRTQALYANFKEVLTAIAAARGGDLTVEANIGADADTVAREVSVNLSGLLQNLRDRITAIDGHAGHLSAASEELTATARQMTYASSNTSGEVEKVNEVVEEMGRTVKSVSVSAQQMTSAVGEIAESAQEARRIAQEAMLLVENANKTVSALGQSSGDIGKVIKVITSIAEQTNLLALNATIEAARAGEAGKGFAVVANEVKELAKETADATDDISQKIDAIQASAKRAVEAILAIHDVIENVNTLSSTIAAAVEEQTAVSAEIRKTFQSVSDGTSRVLGNVAAVNQAATATAGGARDTHAAANAIAAMASDLKALVSQFKIHQSPARASAHVTASPSNKSRSSRISRAV